MPRTKKKAAKKAAAEEDDARSVKRRKACPDCGSRNIMFDTETEQLICHDCGLLFEELVEVEGAGDELRLF
jgi:ribosomal protein S27E